MISTLLIKFSLEILLFVLFVETQYSRPLLISNKGQGAVIITHFELCMYVILFPIKG